MTSDAPGHGLQPQHAKFKLWKPTTMCYLRRAILSESFAWAIQNGVGIFFAMLFLVVDPMTFALACVTMCIYAAASQVMSLDRSVGGRIFSGAVFSGCMLSAGVLGGALASLAWLARGEAEGLYQLVPLYSRLSRQQQTEFQDWLPRQAAVPLPPFIRDLFTTVAAEAAASNSLFHMPDAGFWILLMILFIIFMLPFSVARADEAHGGLLMSIPTFFMGCIMIMGALLPTMGLDIYWDEVVFGFIKGCLITALAMALSALLFFAYSSHDEVREQLGRLLQGAGALAGHAGSVATAPAVVESAEARKTHYAAVGRLTDEAEIKAVLERDARALAASLMPAAAADLLAEKSAKAGDEEVSATAPVPEAVLELRARATKVQKALASAVWEPPLWGIASQPGSNRGHYAALLATTQRLTSALGGLDACAADAHLELGGGTSVAGRATQTALALCSASCAASCADLSVALRHMPLKGPCSGPELSWRPRPDEYWQDLAAALDSAADALQPDTDGAVAESVYLHGRAAVIAVACCEVVIQETKAMEAAAAVALGVTAPPPPKHALSFKEKIAANSYTPGFMTLLVMGLGIPIWIAFIKGTVSFCRGTVTFCRSSTKRAAYLRDKSFQFAVKYWFGMSLAMVVIIVIMWKAEATGAATPMADLKNLDYFFTVWQPMYAWIALSICTQQYVEGTAYKGVLRAVMTAVGGTLGYAAMLNGSLAQNPYYATGIVVLFTTVCSLLSPVRTLRYSLFLVTNTFNSVVACQYVGCCDVAGTVEVYGGKVLSTLLGVIYSLLLSWFLPYYTSERMLYQESGALKAGMALIRRQLPQEVHEREACDGDNQGWMDAEEESLRAPLGIVRNDLQTNIIESRRIMLHWTVIPPPPVVAPLAAAISRMADTLSGADSIAMAPNIWSGPAGPAQSAMLDALRPQTEAVLAAAAATVAACSDCMAATAWKDVRATRTEVARTLDALWTAKAALQIEFIRWNGEKGRPAWTLPDLRFMCWKHIILIALREVDVCAVLLSEGEASLDRPGRFAWAAAMCGRRPA